jgi:uncharacterized protein
VADPAALAAFDGLTPMTVVTGASEGIGLALAKRFAAAGNDVLMIARRPEVLEKVAAEITLQYRVRAVPLALDMTAAAALPAIDAALAAAKSYADIAVNNAAIGLCGDFATMAPADLDRLIALNISALTGLTRHVLPAMLIRGRGGILNVASLGAYTPGPYQAAYYASKAYVLSLTEALTHEVAGHGVTVAAVAPGAVATGFHARMGAASALYTKLLPMPSAQSVADFAYWRFRLGQRVSVPGLVNGLAMLGARIMPHRILLVVAGAILKPRS